MTVTWSPSPHTHTYNVSLQKQNDHLLDELSRQEQDHQLAMEKLQQHYEDRVAKMREQYVGFTASLLSMKDRENLSQGSVGIGGRGGEGGGGGATSKTK